MLGHICEHDEIEIEEGDFEDGDVLRAGMKVLIPCSVCGDTPMDTLGVLEARSAELQEALLAYQPAVPLYHWSPRARRKQIERYGLRPSMRVTTTSDGKEKPPYVCFADSPSWGWALSGGMGWTPYGEWDLWQTWMDRLQEPTVLASPDRPSGIYEVRAEHRIFKRDLFYVGSRTK